MASTTPPTRLSRPVSFIEPTTVLWMIEGFVAFGGFTDLSGPPGCGKSALALQLAADLSRGRTLPGGHEPSTPMATLILCPEDDHFEVRRRLDGMDANLDLVSIVPEVPGPDGERLLDLSRDLDLVATEIRLSDAGFVIIDNLGLGLGRAASSEVAVRTTTHGLNRLATTTNTAMIGIRHWSKRPGGSAVNAGIGSIGISATVRSATIVAPDPDDPDRSIWAVAKTNSTRTPSSLAYRVTSGPSGAALVEWEGEAEWSADELLRTTTSRPARSPQRDAAVTLLRVLLHYGPRARSEIEDQARDEGIGWRTIEAAKADLGVEAHQIPVPGQKGPGPSWWGWPGTDWTTLDPGCREPPDGASPS